MADNHGAVTADDEMDMPAHEASYAQFVATTQLLIVVLVCHLLLLVLWGLKGHPFVALIGFILTLVSGAIGGMTGLGWRAVAPIFVLLGLCCLVL